MDKVGVYIQLVGEDETTSKIEALKKLLDQLEKDKINITVNAKNAQATVKELTSTVNQLKVKINEINKTTLSPSVKATQIDTLNKKLATTQSLLQSAKAEYSTQTASLARNTASTTEAKKILSETTANMFSEAEARMVREGVNAYHTAQDEVAREINSASASSKKYEQEYAEAYEESLKSQRESYVKYWEERLNTEEQATKQSAELKKQQLKNQQQAAKTEQQNLKAQQKAYEQYYQRMTNIGIGLQNIGQLIRQLGQTGTMYFSVPTATAAVASVKAYSDYDYNLRKVSSILSAEGQLSDNTMSSLANQVLEISESHAMTQSDILDAMYNAISAGVSGDKSVEFVKAASELAEAGFSDTTTVTDLLTSIVNAYDDFSYNADSLSSISDMLLQTQNYGKIIVDQMASVLPQVIPVGNVYGVGFQDILASLITMTKQGITPSASGTYLSQLMSQLGKTSGNAGKLFAKYAGETFTEYMKDHTLDEALQTFQKAVKKSGNEVGNYLTNKRALAGYSALMGNLEDFQTQQKNVADAAVSGGAITQAAYQEMAESLSFQIQQIKANLTTLGTTIGSILAPYVLEGIDAIQGLIDTFNSWDTEKQTKFLSTIGKIAVAFPVIWALGSAVQFLGNTIKGFAFIGKTFGGVGGIFSKIFGKSGSGGSIATAGADTLVTFGTKLKGIGTAFAGATAFVAVLAEVGAVIYEYGKVLEAISNLDIGEDFSSNLSKTLGTLGLMSGLVAGVTALFTNLSDATKLKALEGELLTAGYVADIALVGQVIKQYADIVQYISDLDIDADYENNVSKVSAMFAVLSSLTAVSTAIGGVAGLPMAIGELLTAGFIADLYLMSQVLSTVGDVTEHISDLDINGNRVSRNVDSMTDAMSSIGTMILSDGFSTLLSLPAKIAGHIDLSIVTGTIEPLIDMMQQLNDADIPSETKVTSFADSISSITDAVTGAGGNGLFKSLGKMLETNNDANMLSNVKDAIGTITEIFTSIGDMTTSLTAADKALEDAGGTVFVTSKIAKIMTALESAMNAISTGNGGLSSFFSDTAAGLGYSAENGMLTNINKAIETLTTVIESVATIQTKLGSINTYSLQGLDANGNSTGNSLSQKVGIIMTQIYDALSAVTQGNSDIGALLYGTTTIGITSLKESALSEAISTIGTIIDSVTELQTKLNDVNTYSIQGVDANGNSTGNSLSERVSAIVGQINEILGLFGADNQNAFSAGAEALATKFDATKVDNIKQAFAKVGELITTVADVQTTLNGAEIGDTETINTLFNNLTTILTDISTLGTSIPFDTATIGDWTGREQTLTAIATAVGTLKSTILKLKELDAQLAEMETDENGGYTIGTKIQNMLNSINNALGGLSSEDGATNFDGLSQIASTISTLVGALQQLSSAIDQPTQSATKLSQAFAQLQQASVTLQSSLQTLGSSAVTATSGMNSLSSSAHSTASSLLSAVSAAYALASAINAIPSTKNVSVTTSGTVSSGKKSTKRVKKAIGGRIERSGTDTVPALLTPGEFVIRKSSARLLGANVLNRLNHADLTGAMVALSRKIGVSGYAVNNTRNYNNNATVTQNITTNNPNYSYRRARRWVAAL